MSKFSVAVAFFLPGRAKDLPAPLYYTLPVLRRIFYANLFCEYFGRLQLHCV
jgi:hypothetical protein